MPHPPTRHPVDQGKSSRKPNLLLRCRHDSNKDSIGPCDVTSKADLSKLNKELASKESGLHLLVCNAGISGPKAETSSSDATELRDELWSKEDPEAWSSVFNTNVSSVYFTALAFLPMLQAVARGGDGKEAHQTSSIIVISSMSGIMRHAQGHFSYNAAKGATVHLARLMSAEFEKTGVRVNSIAPGYFPSEMTTGESDDKQKSQLHEDKIKSKPHPVPAARAGSDEEMAQTCLFLAKNRYVNGEVIAVDGGVLNQVAGR